MNILTIEESLKSTFERCRLVFWYDESGEWRDAFAAVSDGIATKLEVNNNEFGTKVRILSGDPQSKYLLYIPSARPENDLDNWLLDLLLMGHEFRPDGATLILNELGLGSEFRELVEEHPKFFNSKARLAALRELMTEGDDLEKVRLRMLAVRAGNLLQLEDILLHLLDTMDTMTLVDPAEHLFGSDNLSDFFWELVERDFAYTSDTPSVRDFVVTLFRGANPLDEHAKQNSHSRVFLQRWKDRGKYQPAFENWSAYLQEQLNIEQALGLCTSPVDLGDADAFELFEKYVLHQLCQEFSNGLNSTRLGTVLEQRRGSFWWERHSDGYQALERAVHLRELLGSCSLEMDSVEAGVESYQESWWQIDQAYRQCIAALSRYRQEQLMAPIREWVEKAYLSEFLVPLSDNWGEHVRGLSRWECETLEPQRNFFERFVRPFHERDQKVVVIISDALRYEAARELSERLHAQKALTAEIDCLFGSLPSYTQLGMASLLPVSGLSLDSETKVVQAEEGRTDGIENRGRILNAFYKGKAVALDAEEFLSLKTVNEGRPLMREHDVIYIYHNMIDRVGDERKTEVRTFEAVEDAFSELEKIVNKAANINANNILLTSDHGFLFQQDPVDRLDDIPLPTAQEWKSINRRFAIGEGIDPAPGIKLFDAAALGLNGEWTAAFPCSIGRFPLSGSGKQFVHGGFSLQEVMVPIIKLRRARVDETRLTRVMLSNPPGVITSETVSLLLFQRDAVDGKVLPRTVILGIYSPDGTPISEITTITCDSTEKEERRREKRVLLALSAKADAFNNSMVEVRLDSIVPNTNQRMNLSRHPVKLQKLFTSDFNDF